jgi:RNA ligase (TIGR02306 family)
MGILTTPPPDAVEGDDVAALLGITRWEPGDPSWQKHGVMGTNEPGPDGWTFVKYTDIEPLRRHWSKLQPGEEVVCTEKVHGMNGRWCHDGTRLWVGSHERIKRPDGGDAWSSAAARRGLAEALARFPMMILFGEVYGRGAQDLTYGSEELDIVVFDTYDVKRHRYLDHDHVVKLASELGLRSVPVLYRGPWQPELMTSLCEGPTVLGNAAHVREGFVVKPVVERHDDRLGRVILKMIGEGYHMRSESAQREKRRSAKPGVAVTACVA